MYTQKPYLSYLENLTANVVAQYRNNTYNRDTSFFKPDWDPNWWADNHPLGLVGLAYTTVLTRDLGQATHVYTDVLGGTLIGASSSALTGTDNTYVQMGEAVVELATPVGDGTLAADDLAANGQIHHAAAFRVKDLDQAESYLKSKGIEPLARDESTLLTRPDTTHGVPFRWTTGGVPTGSDDSGRLMRPCRRRTRAAGRYRGAVPGQAHFVAACPVAIP